MAMPAKTTRRNFAPSVAFFAAVSVSVWMAVALPMAPAHAEGGTVSQAQLQQKSGKLAKLRARIAKAAKVLEDARGQQDDLQAAVNGAEKKIAHARRRLKTARDKTAAADAKLKETRKQQAQVEAQLELQRRTLASQLRAEYMLGGRSHLHVLLSTSDPGLGGRLLADYGYVAQARGDAIATVQGQIRKLADLEARVQSQHKTLAALEDKRKQALVHLQAEQKHRKKAVAALKARVEDKSAELEALRASEKRLKRLLASIRKQLAEVPKQDQYISGKAFGRQRGHLVWPARGKLLARYGALRAGGPLTWKGLWIAAPQGAPVHAAADGRAVYIGWVSSYGLIILLQHGHGYYTLYGHVASAVVKLGQDVKAGQVIGKAGDTGGYPDSGVYFEIRHDNKALDPGKWLAH